MSNHTHTIEKSKKPRRKHWKAAIQASDLPIEIGDHVTKIVRRTRLKRREQIDVATELLQHFEEGLATGTTAQALLASFGDAKQTAKLIRRAKLRQRSLWQQGIRRFKQAFACCVLLYISTACWLAMDAPVVRVDHVALVTEKARTIPEDQRAWPVLRDTMAQLEAETNHPEIFKQIGLIDVSHTDWPKVSQWLSTHQTAIDNIRQATHKTGFGFTGTTSPANKNNTTPAPVTTLIPSLLEALGTARQASNLLASDTAWAMEHQDSQRVQRNLLAMLQIAAHVDETNFLVTQVVRISIQSRTFETLSCVLSSHPDLLTTEQLTAFAHAVAALRDDRIDVLPEKHFLLDLIQRCYTDDGHGDGHFDPGAYVHIQNMLFTNSPAQATNNAFFTSALTRFTTPAAAWLMPSRRQALEQVNHAFASASSQFQVPLHEQPQPTPYQTHRPQPSKPAMVFEAMTNQLMPAFDAARISDQRHQGHLDGVLIGLALAIHRLELGQYPDQLSDLVPRYLPNLPFDRITGDPLHYRLIDQSPVVYSVGMDQDDDGGHTPTQGNTANWPTTANNIAAPPPPPDGDWVLWPQWQPPLMP